MIRSWKPILKWTARVVGAVVTAIVYLQWKEITELFELENGVMGTYRPITLGLAYYLFWVFTCRIDGSSTQNTARASDDSQGLSAPEIALFALFVCVAIAAGFFAAQFAYVESIDRSASVIVAKAVGFIVFMAAAGAVLGGLNSLASKR